LWLVSVAVVAFIGYRRAARAARGGDELAGVAVAGLLAVLLSPVAWIHHLCWLPLVLGALVADGRSRRRLLAAAASYAFYVLKVPWWGREWLHHGGPPVLARAVEDGFGLLALILAVSLPTLDGQVHAPAPAKRDSDPHERLTAGRGEDRRGEAHPAPRAAHRPRERLHTGRARRRPG
jgi:alpha-1,2-mannosyltransferase